MNCSVCGSPLLFDRVVLRCECGAFVHAYCVDQHILDSHRPQLEEGHADLNGEFHLKHQPVAALATDTEASESAVAGDAPDAVTFEAEDGFVPGEAVAEAEIDESITSDEGLDDDK